MRTHKGKRNPGKQIVRFAHEEPWDKCVSGIEQEIFEGPILVTTNPKMQLLKILVILGQFWSYACHVCIEYS
jgi:hypothetical protein